MLVDGAVPVSLRGKIKATVYEIAKIAFSRKE
jgi:hypothetical protein